MVITSSFSLRLSICWYMSASLFHFKLQELQDTEASPGFWKRLSRPPEITHRPPLSAEVPLVPGNYIFWRDKMS